MRSSNPPACFCESTLNARVAFSGVFLRIVAGYTFGLMFYSHKGISALSPHELNNCLPILLRETDVKPPPFDNIPRKSVRLP